MTNLPVQFIESVTDQVSLQKRQHDEKFHILQAPDLAYFRAKCEDPETPLAVAFLDIDSFKQINSRHSETKVDRNLLPRFMQTIEAHLYYHGFAYRQGGDEYLILIPSLSRPLAIVFLDELRCKLATLSFADIEEKTTVSIGLSIVEPDCSLTDRELLDRANKAKEFAKKQGKNRIATYSGPRFVEEELQVVSGDFVREFRRQDRLRQDRPGGSNRLRRPADRPADVRAVRLEGGGDPDCGGWDNTKQRSKISFLMRKQNAEKGARLPAFRRLSFQRTLVIVGPLRPLPSVGFAGRRQDDGSAEEDDTDDHA